MDGYRPLILIAASFAACLAAQSAVLRLAARRGWVAHPSQRGLHQMPTATLGGVGCALPILAYLLYAGLQAPPLLGVALALVITALLGLLDDLRELPVAPRLLAHFLAAGLVLWALPPDWPHWAWLAAFFLLVWHTNLVNFMDGIDGLVGVLCLFFCLAAQLLSGGAPGWLGDMLWVASGALIVLLAGNWPPARIMMGDVGSTLLGLLLGVCVMQLVVTGTLTLACCLILLTGLWFDATYTLCIRVATGQRVVEAHRSHLYQKIAGNRGHRWTTLAFLTYSLIWLLPLAWLAQQCPAWGWAWQFAAAAPLAALAYWHRAGVPNGGLLGKV